MKYVYPAIFTEEKEGGYSVLFPDFEGCYTCGDDLAEAIEMAEDVLAFTIYLKEKRQEEIAPASKNLKVDKDSFVNYIACDTLEYQKRNNAKAVKKTLTLPEWLNETAVAAGINFSQTLQEALMQKLHIV